jgi:putative hydrolase of the HAD superfamily
MYPAKNIIFDLGGVLLNIDTTITIDAFRKMGLQQMENLFRVGYAAWDYELLISDESFVQLIATERIQRMIR